MATTVPVLSRVAWDDVNERVRHEQRNREIHVPPISLYRWWARRPHALIGALIDASGDGGGAQVVSDPFSGGGTVAIEASRRGLPIYAQDFHPWALAGLASALDGINPDALEAAGSSVLRTLSQRCGALYVTDCPSHGADSEISNVFWVRTLACPSCASTTYMFPYSLVTLASRSKGENLGYFGCAACGHISCHQAREEITRRCPQCDRLIEPPNKSLLRNRYVNCINAACNASFPAFDGTVPIWIPALVQRLCPDEDGTATHFDTPPSTEGMSAEPTVLPAALAAPIPEGIETSLLRRAGFRQWADLYPPRQLRTLLECSSIISALDTSEGIRDRLRLATCGAAEMAGFLSRWDRYYPKAFEAMANHRFPALGFSCETNLLATRGRGTLRRRFSQSVRAARWASQSITAQGPIRMARSVDRRRSISRGALLVCGSSQRQLPADGSIDLVLTDPPYFDDVQYAELASLFLAWAQAVQLLPSSIALDLNSEAVANYPRGTGVTEYLRLLTQIFREAARTLKPSGRLILTYHNTDIRAWWALSRALHNAGLSVCALAVAEAENSSDHGKRNRNGFTSDLVIECNCKSETLKSLVIARTVSTSEGNELYSVGRTLAKAGSVELKEFVELYRQERGSIKHTRIRIPELDNK
jgi:putative DNA methylase